MRWGDPVSLALFSVLTLVLIYYLERLHCRVTVMLYADDALLLFEGSRQSARSDVEAMLFVMSVFGRISSLTWNRQKLHVLFKGRGVKPTHVAGLEVRDRVRYLGVLLGHVTAAKSYAPSIQKMML